MCCILNSCWGAAVGGGEAEGHITETQNGCFQGKLAVPVSAITPGGSRSAQKRQAEEPWQSTPHHSVFAKCSSMCRSLVGNCYHFSAIDVPRLDSPRSHLLRGLRFLIVTHGKLDALRAGLTKMFLSMNGRGTGDWILSFCHCSIGTGHT